MADVNDPEIYPDDLNPFGEEEDKHEKEAEVESNQVCEVQVPKSARGSVKRVEPSPEPTVLAKIEETVEVTKEAVKIVEPLKPEELEDGSSKADENEQGSKTEVIQEETQVTTNPSPLSSLNPFGDDDEEEEIPEKKPDVEISPQSSAPGAVAKQPEPIAKPRNISPFDPPPRPPPPKILTKAQESYDEALNPFKDDDDEEEAVSAAGKPPVHPSPARTSLKPENGHVATSGSGGSSPRRYKKKAPAPPPPGMTPPTPVSGEDERPRSASRLSNASLDSSGVGTPHRKKKPAPNAPIPPKRVFPDGFKDKLQRELQDVDVKIEQLRRQQETVKRQLAFFGLEEADLKEDEGSGDAEAEHDVEKNGESEVLHEVGKVEGVGEGGQGEEGGSDYEATLDTALENGSMCEDTGSEVSGQLSGGAEHGAESETKPPPEVEAIAEPEAKEDDMRTTERVVEKINLLAEIGEELEDLSWRRKEVVFDLDDYALNEEQADLEHQIRIIQAKPSRLISTEEKEEEAALIKRLMGVVARRDALVERMEFERNLRRALVVESEQQQQLGASSQAVAAGAEAPPQKEHKHKKYKIPKLKSKTLKKIKDKMHAKHGDGDSKRRSSKKS